MAEIFSLDGEDLVKKINCLLRYSSYYVDRDDEFSISVDWDTGSAKKISCYTGLLALTKLN